MQSEKAARPPTRDGVSPSRVALPRGHWKTYEDFLAERFPVVSIGEWGKRIQNGDVMTETGQKILPAQPYQANGHLYYYRELPHEIPIPFKETILYQDEWIIVADKPHFLPVVPSGRYLQETLLVRLKKQLGIDTLSPIHRIDRETAGLVVFSLQPHTRALYQALFRHKKIEKNYEAIASFDPGLNFPLYYESRLVQSETAFMRMEKTDGIPNAATEINLVGTKNGFARYRLKPVTGKKHQLRVQMADLGIPIVNDRIYPSHLPEEKDEHSLSEAFKKPLQLLAKSLSFVDPVTGEKHYFESHRQLVF